MWGIAWRNFFLQRQRYRILTAALVLGGVVFTLLFGVTASLTKTVREKAAHYFSGDVVVLAFERKNDFLITDEPAISEAIAASGVGIEARHRRSLYYGADAQLFFNGASLIQRRVVGVDFSVEAESFQSLGFVAGRGPSAEGSARGVWISDDTARRLHLKVGESVILLLSTVRGFKNTVNLVVDGIFADSSLFGFACYLDYRTLNKALDRDESSVTELGVTLTSSWDERAAAQSLQRELELRVPTTPLLFSKDSLDRWAKANRSAPKTYGVATLTGRLKQINELVDGIRAVNYLLTAVFLIVVSIGVFNTYQMIVFERTREIGTMRALGLSRPGVVWLFVTECLVLGVIGALGGLALGTAALWILGRIDFSGNLLAEMFLIQGHLAWVWPLENISLVVGVLLLTSIAGALVPAMKGARQSPVDALRQD